MQAASRLKMWLQSRRSKTGSSESTSRKPTHRQRTTSENSPLGTFTPLPIHPLLYNTQRISIRKHTLLRPFSYPRRSLVDFPFRCVFNICLDYILL